MKDEQILQLYWDRDERAIAHTELHYGRRLEGLAYRCLWA